MLMHVVYMCMHVRVCMLMYMHTCDYVCTYLWLYVLMCVSSVVKYAYRYPSIYVWLCVFMCMNVMCVFINMNMCNCVCTFEHDYLVNQHMGPYT